MRKLSRLLFVAMLFNACAVAFAQNAPPIAKAARSAITGRVLTTNANGEDQPLPGVGIILMPAEFSRERMKPVARATTGADGFYRLSHVPAGMLPPATSRARLHCQERAEQRLG